MVFFVTKENKVVTALTGFLLILGVTIAIATSLLVYRFTFDFPELRIPAMAIVLFAGFYLSRVFVIGPLAFAVAFVLAATQSIAELMPSAEYLVHSLLWLWVAVAYPIALTVVVNQFLLPAHPYIALVRELQSRLDATTGLIERKLWLTAVDEQCDNSLQQLATRGSSALFKLLSFAEIAEPRLKRQRPAQSAAIMATERLVVASAALALQGPEPLTPDDRRCLEALRAEAARLRTALPQSSLEPLPAKTKAIAATLPEIHELQRAMASLRESLEDEATESAEAASPAKPRKRLLSADAFTNPAHVHFALKVTLAAMVCYILYTAVDWAGIHTAFITCCFIALENTGATIRKGALRLVGCIVGGLLGFLSVLYLIRRWKVLPRSRCSLPLSRPSPAGSLQAVNAWPTPACKSHSPSTCAFCRVLRRTPTWPKFATASWESSSASPSLRWSSATSGLSAQRIGCAERWRGTRNVARLLTNPQPQTSLETTKVEARNLRAEITTNLDETVRLAQTAPFENDEVGPDDRNSASTSWKPSSPELERSS